MCLHFMRIVLFHPLGNFIAGFPEILEVRYYNLIFLNQSKLFLLFSIVYSSPKQESTILSISILHPPLQAMALF